MLPHLRAVELLGHAAQGQTLPLILDCVAGRLSATFQVKVAGRRNGLTDRELACEALCTTLAGAVGLHVSTPACVTLSDGVMAAIESRYAMELSGNFGAGVLWLDYLRPLVLPVDIYSMRRGKIVPNPALAETAGRILALDLILCNSDRTAANPNLAWDGDSLLVFDFEHCLELPGPDLGRMLAVHAQLLPNLRASHIFSRIVSSSSLREELNFCLEVLDAQAATGLGTEGVPSQWRQPWKALFGYVEYLYANRSVIIDAAIADT